MVGTYVSPVRVYKYPFELVMEAYQLRFPTSPRIPVFLGSEITWEEKSDDGATHAVERRCKLAVNAPFLLKKVAGVDCLYFMQRNTLDRRARTMKILAWNETWSSRIAIKEECFYRVHPENADWTCYEQNGSLEIKSFFGFESLIEKLGMKQYTTQIKNGKEVMDFYIKDLLAKGVTYIPPFEDKKELAEASQPVPDDSQVVPVSDHPSPKVVVKETTPVHLGSIGERIDSDYIARFLGELDPFQESDLIKFRQGLAASYEGKLPDDTVLLRFLRARDFNLDKSHDMLLRSMAWRKQYQVDRILDSWRPPKPIEQYFCGGWHYEDKEGRPLYVLRVGQLDVKGLLKTVGEGALLKHLISVEEDGLLKTTEATTSAGKPTCAWTCICDLEGLSMRHLWHPGLKAVHRMMDILKDNYPETLNHLLIVRAPRFFPVLWALVYPFIDPNTRQKIVIYTGNDHQHDCGGLSDYIPRGCIPDFLGGPSKCDIASGGLVPKSLYKQFVEDDNDQKFEALYESASVSKGCPKQVVINVSSAESVITWDFDVITGDIVFSLFRITPESSPRLSRSLSHLTDPEHPPVIDLESAQPVQEMLVVHEGQSVQGSHVCVGAGLYIMQWVFTVTPTSTGLQTHRHRHKASIMFCYEVIGSEDFRGSVSSLESCTSGISTRSSGTATGNSHSPSQYRKQQQSVTRTIATQTECNQNDRKKSTIV